MRYVVAGQLTERCITWMDASHAYEAADFFPEISPMDLSVFLISLKQLVEQFMSGL